MQSANPIESEVVVSRAREGDVSAIYRLAESAKLSYWSYEDYLGETTRPDSIFLVANGSEGLLGFLLGRVNGEKESEFNLTAEIYNIAVVQSVRKKGVGAQLLNRFKDDARTIGVSSIFLEVRSSNFTGQRFYTSHGFIPEGLRKNFYRHPEEDAIVMKSII